jgi:hypothetical protein
MRLGDRKVLLGQMPGRNQTDPRGHFKQPSASNDDQASVAGYFNRLNLSLGDAKERVGISWRRRIGADHNVCPGDDGSNLINAAQVILDGGYGCGQLGRITGDCGDPMPAAYEFLQNTPAGVAGGSIKNDVHLIAPSLFSG